MRLVTAGLRRATRLRRPSWAGYTAIAALVIGACTTDGEVTRDPTTTTSSEGGVVDCGTFDVAIATENDRHGLIEGYTCLRQSFDEPRPAQLTLFLVGADNSRIPTTYTVERGTILVTEQHPDSPPTQQRCRALEGDDDGSVRPVECEPV